MPGYYADTVPLCAAAAHAGVIRDAEGGYFVVHVKHGGIAPHAFTNDTWANGFDANSFAPSRSPTSSAPTNYSSADPTSAPTRLPTALPTPAPNTLIAPTAMPFIPPSAQPSPVPTSIPTTPPSPVPTSPPSHEPTYVTWQPTSAPTS